jgi:CRP/FNR family cyclic AMP-dependent transcriptional regulator
MPASSFRTQPVVALLDVDPDLASAVPPAELEVAKRRSRAAVIELEGPSWDPEPLRRRDTTAWLGLYLVEGLMIRCVSVGRQSACELFGPGDILRPWDADGEYEPLSVKVEWRVPSASRLAVLDGSFGLRIARWPSVSAGLIGRVARRARHLAVTQAVTHLPRTWARVLMLFWLLAERWGRVGPDGIRVQLPLTHELLSMLVGAHRPTVTTALRRLDDSGLLHRERRDSWLLTRAAVDRLCEIEQLRLIDQEVDGRQPDEARPALI